MKTDQTIDTCESISIDEFNECYFEKKPLLMRGMTGSWKARQWTPEYFAETFGDAEVILEMKIVVSEESEAPAEIARKRVKLADYVRAIRQDVPDCGYLSVYPIMTQFPALKEHIRFPKFGWSGSMIWNEFFLGPKGSWSPLHYDTMSNLFCQIYGRKTFLVISPEYDEACYPSNQNWQDGYSLVDVKNIDLQRFPKFEGVRAAEVILGPGDLLYVPGSWWHAVQSLDVAISVNQWFYSERFFEKNKAFILDPDAHGSYDYPIDESMKRYHD